MASISLGLRCTQPISLPNSRAYVGHPCRLHTRRARTGVCGAVQETKAKEWQRLKQLFHEAYDRCHSKPTEGVPFTPEEFCQVVDKEGESPIEVGAKVKGTIYVDEEGEAYADIGSKSLAHLPIEEACLYDIDHVYEAGLVNGLQEEFLITEEDLHEDTYTISLKEIQNELSWERCRQLQAEDVVVTGKICGGNRGGAVVLVEGLRGFVPFSQISTTLDEEELMDVELPLKFVEVDEELSRLVLSNRKAVADSQAQLGIGSVVTGVVQSLKPYGAFIDIGGINGLLHVSQISHDRVSDIETVLQPGDQLKVMVLSHDRERGRISLSTKKLEPNPGDMIRNPKLVFEKAEEMAQIFRQRIAYAEAVARADMLRFQPESGLSLSSEGILGPLTPASSNEGLDPTNTPSAEASDTSSQPENSS